MTGGYHKRGSPSRGTPLGAIGRNISACPGADWVKACQGQIGGHWGQVEVFRIERCYGIQRRLSTPVWARASYGLATITAASLVTRGSPGASARDNCFSGVTRRGDGATDRGHVGDRTMWSSLGNFSPLGPAELIGVGNG